MSLSKQTGWNHPPHFNMALMGKSVSTNVAVLGTTYDVWRMTVVFTVSFRVLKADDDSLSVRPQATAEPLLPSSHQSTYSLLRYASDPLSASCS